MKFGHVGITVSNLKRSTEFYHLAFGFEPFFDVERTEPWVGDVTGYGAGTHLRFQHMRIVGVMHLELIEYMNPVGSELSHETYFPGNVHFSLFVDDIDLWTASAMNAGATSKSLKRPVEISGGPNKGAKVIYLRDPDGITIELFQEPRT